MAAALAADEVAELVAVAEADLQVLALTAGLAMRPNVPADVPTADSEQRLKNPMAGQMLV
jgi:hypothetical protein